MSFTDPSFLIYFSSAGGQMRGFKSVVLNSRYFYSLFLENFYIKRFGTISFIIKILHTEGFRKRHSWPSYIRKIIVLFLRRKSVYTDERELLFLFLFFLGCDRLSKGKRGTDDSPSLRLNHGSVVVRCIGTTEEEGWTLTRRRKLRTRDTSTRGSDSWTVRWRVVYS